MTGAAWQRLISEPDSHAELKEMVLQVHCADRGLWQWSKAALCTHM